MQKDNNIFIRVGKRIFQMLGQWSILAFTLALTKNFESENIVSIMKYIIIAIGLGLLIYYVITSIRLVKEFYRIRKSYSKELLEKKSSIGYEVGSFWDVVQRFENEENVAVIIGINNRFCIESNYINSKSLLSNYISMLTQEEQSELRETVHNQLNNLVLKKDDNDLPVYPYGTLCTLNPSKSNHFEVGLLAMCEPSSSKKQGTFATSRKDLILSFEKLFEEMSDHYTDYTLIIPLIGTKSSGGPLTHEEVAKYLISAFANYTRSSERRLARRLVVSIYEKDFETIESIMDIKHYVDIECGMESFSYSTLKSEMAEQNI